MTNNIKFVSKFIPNDIFKNILLYNKSRKEIIEKYILDKSSGKYVLQCIKMKQTESDQYIFISNFIYNPKTQSLMSTQNLIFHSEFARKSNRRVVCNAVHTTPLTPAHARTPSAMR